MAQGMDDKFYERADIFINQANDMARQTPEGQVNASFMYGAARYNSWLLGRNSKSAEDMAASAKEMIEHFTQQYRSMLAEHMADHIRNWDGDHKG